MTRTHALAALAALAAAGCTVGPAYQRPDQPLPPAHRFGDASPATPEASLGDLPWRAVFPDPALQSLIDEALAGSPDLKAQAARVAQAAAAARAAGAGLWPQVAATADASYGRASREVSPLATAGDRWTAGLGLSWELDLWGRIASARDAALADLRASQAVREAARASLVAAVAQAYLELRELDLELEISRAAATARHGSLELFQARSDGGVGNDLELSQMRAEHAVAVAAIPATERLVALKEHQLSLLLGRAPGPIARGAPMTGLALPPVLPAGVPAALLRRRPDVLAAEEAVVAATARARVAAATRLPALSLSGSIALDALSPGRLARGDAAAWSLGGGLLAPLLDGGRLAAQEDAARAALAGAAEDWRVAVLGALRDVADAAVGRRTLAEVRQAQEVQVASGKEAERLALLRLEGGVASALEVLDVQRQSYAAELALARTRRDELLTVVQLYRALGGGWDPGDGAAAR